MQNVSLDRLRQVANLARSVASALDVDTVLRQVVEAVGSLRAGAACVVRLVDVERGGYRLVARGRFQEIEPARDTLVSVIPFGHGLTHTVVQSGQPVLLSEAFDDPRLVSSIWHDEHGPKVYYGVPISAGGETMGVLNVAFTDAPPSAEEREILDLLASHAAVAIGNARLFAASETRRRTAEALAEVWRFLSETFDLLALGQRVADVVLRTLRVRAAALYRLRPGPGDLEVIGRSGEAERFLDPGVVIPAGYGAVGLAVRWRQPVVSPDIRVDPRVVSRPEMLVRQSLCPSVLSLPLVVKGQVVGGFTVGDFLGRVYTEEDRALAQAFADQAAVALENARLFQETERRRRESSALGGVSHILAQSLNRGDVAQRIVDRVRSLMGLLSASVYTVDGETGDLEGIASAGPSAFDGVSMRRPRGTGAVGLAALERRAVVSNDVLSDPRLTYSPEVRAFIQRSPIRSVLAVPLIVKDRVIGALALVDSAGRVFTAEDVQLAQAFADQAAVALENARLFADAERRRRESVALANVSQILAQSLHPDGVAQRVVDLVRDLVGVLAASVFRLDPETGVLEESACSGRTPGARGRPLRCPPGVGAVGLAVAERRPVVSDDILADSRLQYAPDMRAFLERSRVRAILAVPLIVKDEVIGALGLADASGRAFTADDVQLAQAFADQAAVALDNARLYADAERRRVEAETLSGLVRTISATLDLESVLGRVAAAAREQCESDIAHILLRDAESDTMFARYGVGHSVGDADAPRIVRGKGAGGHAWATGRPFRTANRRDDPRVREDYQEAVKREGVVATLAVPIWINGQVEGLLYVSNRRDRAFTDRDEAILIRLADHAAIAIQNATLFSRLQGLSGRLMEVQEAERRHLARELHDEIGQLLTGLRLTLDIPEPASPGVQERLGQAQALVEDLLDRIRSLSLDLRPSILDDLGLLPALLGHAERYTSQTKIRVQLEHSGLDRRFSPETETAAYRIVQEALTNVARHGRVDEVTVRLWATDEILGVQVEDHGDGFDPRVVLERARGGGLAGLRERAALLNGQLTVETEPGRGVRLTAEVPLSGGRRGGE